MAVAARGHVDFGAPGFIARFADDPAIVDRIKAIQRRHWLEAERVWVVEPHWPSVQRLLHIASELGWEITPAAREAEQRVREDDEALEYSVDVIHNAHGEAVFQCKAGEDDALHARLRALPGAYWEDAWCVPTDWERCCGPLLEIVESDQRLTYSNAAWTLLTEPDVTHLYLRSSAPAAASFQLAAPPPAARTQAVPWTATDRDRELQTWSRATAAEGFSVSAALRGSLLPFQIAGVRYILEAKRVLLADDAGLGKTAQALAALETASAYPALVVCPPDQLPTWQAEAERWLPASRKVAIWHAERTAPAPDVLLITYAALAHHQQALGAHSFAAIVADESHYLRHHASRRTQAVLAVAARVAGLRLCLSRTRLSRQPIELATQLAFLGVLGSHFGGFWDFAHRYCAPHQTDDGTVFGADNLTELTERLRAYCYCRRETAALLTQLRGVSRKPRVQSRSALPTSADDKKQVC